MNEYNILIDPLPESVEVGGKEYPISADFRTGILFEMMVNDPNLSDEEKGINSLALWYPDQIPEDLEEAAQKAIWFYSCGRVNPVAVQTAENERRKGASFEKRIYDFDIDAPLIYSAFLTQYRIDLQDVEFLHWWKFSAMFSSLNEDCEITRIMGYRAMDLREIKSKTQRAHYSKLQHKYALPSRMTREQKEAAAGAVFASMMGGGK